MAKRPTAPARPAKAKAVPAAKAAVPSVLQAGPVPAAAADAVATAAASEGGALPPSTHTESAQPAPAGQPPVPEAEANDDGSADAGTAALSPPDAAEIRTYPVRSPLKRDGRRYAIGGTIDLTEAEAETLVALGVLGEA